MGKRNPLFEGATAQDLDDPEVQDWISQSRMRGLMEHEAPRGGRSFRPRGLHFPKHTGELAEVPDVLKGLIREDA